MKNRKEWCCISKASRAESRAESKAERKKMPIGAKILDIAFAIFIYLLAAFILIGAIFFAFNQSPDKSLFGYRYYYIRTASMEPKYKVNDLVFVKVCSADEVEVGDVITYYPNPNSTETYLTHRVVKKYAAEDGTICFITKGDANETADAASIDEGRLVGKVTWEIPKLGYIIEFVKLKWYFILIIAILIGVFFKLLKHYFMLGKEEKEAEAAQKELDEKTDSESDADKKQLEDGNEARGSDADGETSAGTEHPEGTEEPSEADSAGEEPDVPEETESEPVQESSESGSEDELSSEDAPNETSPEDE